MANDDANVDRSPFSKPGFIVSALVVALVLVLGVGVIIGRRSDDDSGAADATADPTGSAGVSTTANAGATSTDGDASICGLEGVVLEGTVTEAPEATWAYHGTAAYPSSPVYGPGATDVEDNFSYCFQHSPEGAIFAASSYMAQPFDTRVGKPWLEYYVADGPYREHLMSSTATARPSDDVPIEAIQMKVVGFRLLSYDGATARVDVAVEATYANRTFYHSSIHDLVWQDGDWKLSTETDTPIDSGNISDLSGYVMWAD